MMEESPRPEEENKTKYVRNLFRLEQLNKETIPQLKTQEISSN